MNASVAPRAAVVATGVGCGLLVLQLALLNHDFTVDGLQYAAAVERGEPLLHPNHLLYNALNHVLWRTLGLLLPSAPAAAWTMQMVNIVAGCVAAAALTQIAAKRAAAPVAAAIGVLLLAGFGFWTFSQEPEVYVLPAALVAVSLLILERAHLASRHAAALALLCAAAVLLLQQYVFWFPLLLWLAWPKLQARGRLLLLTVPWLLPLLVYVALGHANGAFESFDALLRWFLGYGWTADGIGTYRAPPPLAARAGGLLLALGNLWFAYELVASPWAWPLAAAAVLAVLISALPTCRAPLRRGSVPLMLFIGVNLLFTFWWEARNIEFLLPVWIGFVALLALHADRLRSRWLAVGVLLVFAINAALAMLPQRDWPMRYQLAGALADAAQLGPEDVLLTEELNTVLWLGYFHDRPVRFAPGAISALMHADRDPALVARTIDAALARGQRVFTLEFAEHGRLRALAARLPLLGRPMPEGGVDAALEQAYAGFELQPVAAVPGTYEVRPAERVQ